MSDSNIDLISIEKNNDSSVYVSYNIGNSSGSTLISEKRDFYGIPYDVLLEFVGEKLEVEYLQDEYQELKELIENSNHFFVNNSPFCLMTENELNSYSEYLELVKKRSLYTKFSLENIDKRTQEIKSTIESKNFLTEEEAKTEIVKKPIDKINNDILVAIDIDPSFGQRLRIYLSNKYDSDNYIIFQTGYGKLDYYEEDKDELIVKITPQVLKKIKDYLKKIKISLLPEMGAVIDGETRTIKIGFNGNLSSFKVSWVDVSIDLEDLNRLIEYFLNVLKKYVKIKEDMFYFNFKDLIID